mmetsp:Transcript_71054/g.197383  ORF Transcript_71054/g.197383 Transcript_71054/m.197383 type:complete len:164 (+) Transcript_71054:352-843(+)
MRRRHPCHRGRAHQHARRRRSVEWKAPLDFIWASATCSNGPRHPILSLTPFHWTPSVALDFIATNGRSKVRAGARGHSFRQRTRQAPPNVDRPLPSKVCFAERLHPRKFDGISRCLRRCANGDGLVCRLSLEFTSPNTVLVVTTSDFPLVDLDDSRMASPCVS